MIFHLVFSNIQIVFALCYTDDEGRANKMDKNIL